VIGVPVDSTATVGVVTRSAPLLLDDAAAVVDVVDELVVVGVLVVVGLVVVVDEEVLVVDVESGTAVVVVVMVVVVVVVVVVVGASVVVVVQGSSPQSTCASTGDAPIAGSRVPAIRARGIRRRRTAPTSVYATECVMVPVYTPATLPAGTVMVSDGFQVTVLLPTPTPVMAFRCALMSWPRSSVS